MRRRKDLNNVGSKVIYKEDGCLTMHQPWASLLVSGIKRIEGRSWPPSISGRLWIHAASKVPDASTIKAMEDFYREIYALDGVTDLKFPEHYPVSKLLGCVDIVGCLRREELSRWKAVSEGVRLEALTNFCWLCEQPQKLIDPLKMRGDQGVYNLQWKIAEVAARSLLPVDTTRKIIFPRPNPGNYRSLRPGSLPLDQLENKDLRAHLSPNVITAIDGAIAASTQYSKKVNKPLTSELTDKVKGNSLEENSGKDGVGAGRVTDTSQNNNVIDANLAVKLKGISMVEHRGSNSVVDEFNGKIEERRKFGNERRQNQLGSSSQSRSDQNSSGSSLIFSSAVRGIRPH